MSLVRVIFMLNLKAKGCRPETGRSTSLGQHRAKERGGQSGVLRVGGREGQRSRKGPGVGPHVRFYTVS